MRGACTIDTLKRAAKRLGLKDSVEVVYASPRQWAGTIEGVQDRRLNVFSWSWQSNITYLRGQVADGWPFAIETAGEALTFLLRNGGSVKMPGGVLDVQLKASGLIRSASINCSRIREADYAKVLDFMLMRSDFPLWDYLCDNYEGVG